MTSAAGRPVFILNCVDDCYGLDVAGPGAVWADERHVGDELRSRTCELSFPYTIGSASNRFVQMGKDAINSENSKTERCRDSHLKRISKRPRP